MTSPLAHILLVEDEEADVFHFQRLCRKEGLVAAITVARSGDDALAVLRSQMLALGRCLIVTDLNMPGLTGHEFIEAVRGDEELASCVIFVVSTSDLPDDIERAYGMNVAGYIVKDPHGERLEAGIAMLNRYLQAVALH
jgi:CheY-like chemotaxis protein